jgi:hypothetical protein
MQYEGGRMSASGWAGGRATDKQPKGMVEPHLTKKGAQSASFLVEHVLRPARPMSRQETFLLYLKHAKVD